MFLEQFGKNECVYFSRKFIEWKHETSILFKRQKLIFLECFHTLENFLFSFLLTLCLSQMFKLTQKKAKQIFNIRKRKHPFNIKSTDNWLLICSNYFGKINEYLRGFLRFIYWTLWLCHFEMHKKNKIDESRNRIFKKFIYTHFLILVPRKHISNHSSTSQ